MNRVAFVYGCHHLQVLRCVGLALPEGCAGNLCKCVRCGAVFAVLGPEAVTQAATVSTSARITLLTTAPAEPGPAAGSLAPAPASAGERGWRVYALVVCIGIGRGSAGRRGYFFGLAGSGRLRTHNCSPGAGRERLL